MESQGRPFFVVMRCTLPARNPTRPCIGASQDGGPSCAGIDLERDRIASGSSGNFVSTNAVAELHHVSLYGRRPNSATLIRSSIMTRRNMRLGKHFPDPKIANTKKLSRMAFAHSAQIFPSMSSDQSNYHPKRLVIRFREADGSGHH